MSNFLSGFTGGTGSALGWASALSPKTSSTVNMGGGDVAMLRKVLDEMEKSTSAGGMEALMQQIFKSGYEAQMPKLLNAATTAGIRPQDATTQTLLEQDLIARLTGQAAEALGTQQARTAQAATGLAEQTKVPLVTKTREEGLFGIFG